MFKGSVFVTAIYLMASLFVSGYLYTKVHWAVGVLAATAAIYCLIRFRHFFFGTK